MVNDNRPQGHYFSHNPCNDKTIQRLSENKPKSTAPKIDKLFDIFIHNADSHAQRQVSREHFKIVLHFLNQVK